MYNAKPQKLPSGSWRVRINYKGHRKSVTASTKKEVEILADETLEKMIATYYKGSSMTSKGTSKTLGSVIDDYISVFQGSPTTKSGYLSIRRTRFPDYMNIKVSLLDKSAYQKMINQELKKVSPKTVKSAWGLVTAALSFYDIEVPKITLPRVPAPDTGFIPPERLDDFLKTIDGSEDEIAILLGLHGLRRSEILGLRWSDIDLKEKKISIKGALVRDENNLWIRTDLNKNQTSTRKVQIIIDRLYDLLRKESPKGKSNDLIYTRNANTIYKSVAKACSAIGIKNCGVHGLRRTYVSLCVHLGLPEAWTMEAGGWSDKTTMHKHYTKISQGDRSEYSDIMASFFNKKE